MDIDTTADVLTGSHTHLAEAKSHSLTHALIPEATQTGKCWDDIKGILQLKLCNVNIHTYTSCFMEIQQKDNGTYIHHFKTAAKQCALTVTIWQPVSFLRDLRCTHYCTGNNVTMWQPVSFLRDLRCTRYCTGNNVTMWQPVSLLRDL